MEEMTGENYQSSPYAKMLAASEAKVGKTCFLVASILGVLPWQKNGGVVDSPKNLHIITTDSNALGGIKRFLLETCKASPEALGFHVYNMQADLLEAAGTPGWDFTFINTISDTLKMIQDRVKGVPVVMASSLTGLAEGMLNGLKAPPGEQKGAGMDMAKWGDFAGQVSTVRNQLHAGEWHSVWEAHILKMIRKGQGGDVEVTESIQIPGQSGVNFPYNVEQFFRIRRLFGQRWEGTNCDKTFLDPNPTYGFVTNGRNFNEALKKEEYDITSAFHRLGLKIGRWNTKSSTPKAVKKVKE